MPDLTDLLERTTPRQLPPLDIGRLANIARRRRRRNRVAVLSVVAVIGLGAGTVALRSASDPQPDATTLADTLDLQAPAGHWTSADDLPIGPRGGMRGGLLTDGRVLAWGGGSGGTEGGMTNYDGAIYNPATDTWTTVPLAPLPADTSVHWTQLSKDRLVVLGTDGNGRLRGAVLDTASNTWTELPDQGTVSVAVSGMAWDGDTLALIRISRGAKGYQDRPTLDWSVPGPVTLRWTYGQGAWTTGTPAPLSLRFGVGTAFDGHRFALIGGTTSEVEGRTDPAPPGPDRGVVGDGAIYDLANDTWMEIPADDDTAVIHPSVVWMPDGRLAVGGGNDRLSDPGPDQTGVNAYDPAAGSWSALPQPDFAGLGSTNPWMRYASNVTPIVVGGTDEPRSGPLPRSVLTAGGWETAPVGTIVSYGPRLIATSATPDNPGNGPFELFVRAAPGAWVPGAEAPFDNRMDPVIVVAGDRLIVIGGYEGVGIEPTATTWIWELGDD